LTCSFHFWHLWSAIFVFFYWHLSVTSYETKQYHRVIAQLSNQNAGTWHHHDHATVYVWAVTFIFALQYLSCCSALMKGESSHKIIDVTGNYVLRIYYKKVKSGSVLSFLFYSALLYISFLLVLFQQNFNLVFRCFLNYFSFKIF
jgi:hypothetical protein